MGINEVVNWKLCEIFVSTVPVLPNACVSPFAVSGPVHSVLGTKLQYFQG
jgi:hypothetical protein